MHGPKHFMVLDCILLVLISRRAVKDAGLRSVLLDKFTKTLSNIVILPRRYPLGTRSSFGEER